MSDESAIEQLQRTLHDVQRTLAALSSMVDTWTPHHAVPHEAERRRSSPERRPPPGAAAPARSAYLDGLTRREQQVASLVAEGLTNKEIGARLGIARRTVDTHVASSFSKLGLATRTQLSRWAIEREAPAFVERDDRLLDPKHSRATERQMTPAASRPLHRVRRDVSRRSRPRESGRNGASLRQITDAHT